MQASKIIIGEEYAVRCDGELCRLKVTKVVTTRTGSHSSDFSHIIYGTVTGRTGTLDFGPSAIEGPYTEHVELVRQKEVEKKAAAERAKAKLAAAQELVDRLYLLSGLPQSAKPTWNDLIRVDYDRDVTIKGDAVAALLDKLQGRTLPKAG